MKKKYPTLKTKENSPIIKQQLNNLYKLFGSVFDGYLLRV